MLSVECGVWSVECGVWSVKSGVVGRTLFFIITQGGLRPQAKDLEIRVRIFTTIHNIKKGHFGPF